jgi:hypothetical protein
MAHIRIRPAGVKALVLAALLLGCAAWAQDTVASLRERIVDLQNKGTLGVRSLAMCRSVATYGQYVRNDARRAAAGSTIWFYYEPENVYTQKDRDTYRIWYTQDIVVLGKDGKELLRSNEVLSFTHLGYSPVLDLYATNELDLGELAPGEYRYRVILHDKLRGTDATAELAFTIAAKG